MPVESLDVKKIAENVAKMVKTRPFIPSLNDLAQWENELFGLKERASHCEGVIALVQPEISQVESELEVKTKALNQLKDQLGNSLIANDVRHPIADLELRISRLTHQLSELKERLQIKQGVLAGTKKNIAAFYKGHPELDELRKAQKQLDAATGR
jgi:chromosome segregation ATPase